MASAPRRVLIVDDHRDTGETWSLIDRALGTHRTLLRLRHSRPGAARVYCPDVVLLDLAMPAMSGYEVARRLRETPLGRRATILAVSGFCRDQDRHRSAEELLGHWRNRSISEGSSR